MIAVGQNIVQDTQNEMSEKGHTPSPVNLNGRLACSPSRMVTCRLSFLP